MFFIRRRTRHKTLCQNTSKIFYQTFGKKRKNEVNKVNVNAFGKLTEKQFKTSLESRTEFESNIGKFVNMSRERCKTTAEKKDMSLKSVKKKHIMAFLSVVMREVSDSSKNNEKKKLILLTQIFLLKDVKGQIKTWI